MAVQTGGWQRRSYRAPPKRLTTSSGPAYRHPRHISPSAFTIPPLFHSPPPKFTSAFYSFVVISHMIRHAILPRPLAAKSRNNCLPSSAVNSRQNAELFHLTAFLSAFSALFFPMGVRQLLLIHALPHSFHRNGGVGGMTVWKTRASLQPLSTIDCGLSCSSPACPDRSRGVTASHNSFRSHTYGPFRKDVPTKHLQPLYFDILNRLSSRKPFKGTFLEKTGGWGQISTGNCQISSHVSPSSSFASRLYLSTLPCARLQPFWRSEPATRHLQPATCRLPPVTCHPPPLTARPKH